MPNRMKTSLKRRSAHRVGTIAALTIMAVSLQGCGSVAKDAPSRNTTEAYRPPFKAVASIKELMDSTVDPSADGVWESVGTIVTYAGVDKRQPHTDEQWHAVRRHATTLIEAMNLVMMDGRHAAPPGTKPNLGELSPAQIDAAVAANRPEFDQFAENVRDNALKARDAIDRKDVQALITIGGDIDQSCEGCHVTFWYPNSARPSQ